MSNKRAFTLPEVKVKETGETFPKPTVAVYYPHGEEISSKFHASILNMALADISGPQFMAAPGTLTGIRCGVNVCGVRNTMCEMALESGAEWMLQLDADMKFDHDLLPRLLRAAHPTDRPIVGGLCFRYMPDADLPYQPTMYAWMPPTEDRPKPIAIGSVLNYEKDGMMRVTATGAACLLVHRSVLQKMKDSYPGPWHWFAEQRFVDDRGVPDVFGEDLTFCLRAGECGFPIHVDTSIKVGHMKTFEITEAHYEFSRALGCGGSADNG